ncbi:MAG: hypothetical protein NT008_04145 [Methylococcales bacterium]|nr:hypothetical protein [Methylococcales bacterium]
MKITTIAICISAFLFSFNANGLENKEQARNASPNQILSINKVVFNLENQGGTILVGTDIVEHKLLNQSPLNNQDINFFTKFCILLGISMVYWIYWLRC